MGQPNNKTITTTKQQQPNNQTTTTKQPTKQPTKQQPNNNNQTTKQQNNYNNKQQNNYNVGPNQYNGYSGFDQSDKYGNQNYSEGPECRVATLEIIYSNIGQWQSKIH